QSRPPPNQAPCPLTRAPSIFQLVVECCRRGTGFTSVRPLKLSVWNLSVAKKPHLILTPSDPRPFRRGVRRLHRDVAKVCPAPEMCTQYRLLHVKAGLGSKPRWINELPAPFDSGTQGTTVFPSS